MQRSRCLAKQKHLPVCQHCWFQLPHPARLPCSLCICFLVIMWYSQLMQKTTNLNLRAYWGLHGSCYHFITAPPYHTILTVEGWKNYLILGISLILNIIILKRTKEEHLKVLHKENINRCKLAQSLSHVCRL